jgi:hypothetical protein
VDDEFVTFVVGKEKLTAASLTIQRFKKMWPHVEEMAKGGTMVSSTTPLSCIIAAATEQDENLLDQVPIEDLGRVIERKLLVTQIAENQSAFTRLMQISGMGAKPGKTEATANPSTEIGTE